LSSSSSSARGIHTYPTLKLGKAPPVEKPKLRLARLLTGVVPDHPAMLDNLRYAAGYGLDNNDKYGVCVPTAYDNYRRLVTGALTGKALIASQDQIYQWYKTQNPGFDPVHYNESNDQGMVIQDFLSMLVKAGEIVAFAAVDQDNHEEVKAALYLFLGLLAGVDLDTVQRDQLRGSPPVWDFSSSPPWGGHCIMLGAYDATGVDCVTWAERVKMTSAFLRAQMDEAWVVIRPEHLANPTFREGIDLATLASSFRALTGRELPLPEPPTNSPVAPPMSQLVINITDPEVVQHVTKVAKSSSVDEWATHHFRSYFRIK
jgi:hypothetical protein